MIYTIYGAIFLQLIISDAAELKLTSVPQIYPRKSHVVVDSHTDLVLGCRGAEPLRWTFHDDVNSRHYNSSQENIMYMNNTIELEYKFETILTIYNVSHVNVGFYYCHGEEPDFDTPRRSNRIYVFVHDDNNLSVITSGKYRVYGYLSFRVIPCKPTSPDINITVKCQRGLSMSVTPSNYSEFQMKKHYTVRFDPYEGFTVRGQRSLIRFGCSCFFEREIKNFSLKTEFHLHPGNYINKEHIGGSDTVNVRDNITLLCSALRDPYYPHYKEGLQWKAPSSENYAVENHYTLKLKHYILLISTLTIINASSKDEGYYQCTIPAYSGQANKYVAVNAKQGSQSPPRIYYLEKYLGPDQEDIQVNSGDNITLCCEGSRPVTWSWSEEYYIPYNNRHVTYAKNKDLYYSFLKMAPVRHTSTEFYYCHEKDYIKEHPFKSRIIYIFVKDEQNLQVEVLQWKEYVYVYGNVTVPCRATSKDVNIKLSMRDTERFDTMPINLTIYAYDPREGFTIQMPPRSDDATITCTFIADTLTSTLEFKYDTVELNSEPHIEGPHESLVFVGDTLQLSCTAAVTPNIPDDALRWTFHNNSISSDITTEKINVAGAKVLISKLFIYNVKNTDEGKYTCYLPYNNATASKFISVYASFEVKPYIKNLTYHYAYVGQPFVLRCGVNVSHNVDFSINWTAPNATKKHIRIMNAEYTLDVRYRKGLINLEIDNVTLENEGNYSCYVSVFKHGIEKVTKFVPVKRGQGPKMRIAPSYVNNPEEIDAQVNEPAKLICPTEGDPKPTIIWMNHSSKVQSIARRTDFSADNSELTILFVQRFDAGLYTCIARNPYGNISRDVYVRVKSDPIIGIMIAVFICMIIMITIVAVAFNKFENNKKRRRWAILEAGPNNFKFGETEKAALSAYNTKWEIPRNKIKLGRNLGSGYFGLVVKGTISNYFDGKPVKTVAVKMLHQNCNITALHSLISELNILTHLGKHANLISLLGACTENIAQRYLLVVIEYCEHGSVRNYLLENRNNFVNLIDPDTELITMTDVKASACGREQITTLKLMHWALQVARGMEFLASMKVVHGDLAARNVLLAENYVVKISDFGLSRNLSSNDYYRKKSQCQLPVKWMALESIRDKTFSTWSDVWSFGVVLWELFSLALTPYAELEPDFRFYRKLESGYRLDQPQYSTREIYQVMRECWCAQPQRRPTFSNLVHTLDDLLQDVHTRCTRSQHHYVNVSGECSTAASSRGDDNIAAQDWIALDVLTSTEMGSNT